MLDDKASCGVRNCPRCRCPIETLILICPRCREAIPGGCSGSCSKCGENKDKVKK